MKVLFFARARELAGVAEAAFDDVPGQTIADVRRAVAERYPRLTSLLPHCAAALADDFVADATPVPPGAVVALLPPASGG